MNQSKLFFFVYLLLWFGERTGCIHRCHVAVHVLPSLGLQVYIQVERICTKFHLLITCVVLLFFEREAKQKTRF